MDSIYCSGTDVEMSRMFDQYLFKVRNSFDTSCGTPPHSGPESFDLSLTIPDPNHENATSYMSSDQTFHTPSFGDEEFEIPPISLPPSSMASETSNEATEMPGQGYNAPVMTHSAITEPVSVITLGGPTLSSQTMMVGSSPTQVMGQQQQHYPSHGLYLQTMAEGTTMLTSQPNQLSSQSFETQPTYTLSAHATGAGGTQLLIQQQPQQQQQQQPPSQQQQQQQMMGSSLLTTITPASTMGTQQMGMPYMVQRTSSVNGSPPGSNQTSPGQETSEDSDDSAQHSHVGGNTPLIQLMGGLKRPSPEPVDIKNPNLNKKPKVPKKKKKRDPNEPQKPVSAYALFFRDTQAAIKGQNPNASFGEVSKIVASMWDSLDADHKNVYKKKTEAAKKEYLKALAAYRASLVSKQTTSDHMDSMYGSGPATYGSTGPSYTPQQQPSNVLSSSTVMMTTSLAQPMPPIQQHQQMQVPPPQSPNLQSQSQPSPMNQAMQQHPSQQSVSTGSSYQQQTNYSQQPQANIPVSGGQQQQQQQPITSPQGAVATTQPPLNSRPTTCLRNGCQNPPVESPEWDSEYCRTFLLPGWLPARLPILLPQ